MAKKEKRFFLYLKLPEMLPFWIILLPLLVLVGVNFYFLSYLWGLVSLLVSSLLLIAVFGTSLKSAKTRYQLSLERMQIQALIESFPEAVIAYDSDFKILVFNPAAEQFFNLKKEELIGKKITPDWVKNEKTRLLAQILFPSLAPSLTWQTAPGIYPQVVNLSFNEPHLELSVITIRVETRERILGFFKIIKDRTREEEILQAKSEFLTVAAHQLRTPLSGIKWGIEALRNEEVGPLNEAQKDLLNQSLEAVEKTLRLANDLLDTANIEAGKYGYEFIQADLVSLIKKVLEDYLPIAERYNIKIYFEPPPDGLAPFKFDPLRIKIVFQNLIENALRYNVRNGEVIIKLEKKPPYLEVSVSDTGIGIPKEELPKIFTKFFRASNVLKYETEGTGLGLYITKNIIEAHGGKIWVDSIENRGTTFYFTLPLDEKLIPRHSQSPI